MPPGPDHLKRHEAAGEARADAADAVVRPGGCRSGNSGSVPVGGRRIGVVVDEVVALQDRTREVRMCGLDTRVDDRDDDLRRAGGQVPGGGEVQGRVRRVRRIGIARRQRGGGRREHACGHRGRGGCSDPARRRRRTVATVATGLDSRHAPGVARSRRRARACGFVRRHARAAGDPRRVRRRDHHRRVGADLVQPRARGRRRAGRVRLEEAAARGVRRGRRRLRRGVAGVRARALVRGARRRPVRPGARRGAARHGGTRSPLAGGGERRGGAPHLGCRGRARRRARPCRRRNPHAAARLGVDLPRAGAARAGVVARGARSGRSAARRLPPGDRRSPRTPRCSSSRAASSPRSSSSCSSWSTGGGCHRPRPASS